LALSGQQFGHLKYGAFDGVQLATSAHTSPSVGTLHLRKHSLLITRPLARLRA